MPPEAQWITYGVVLIVILFVMPRGIVPSLASRLGLARAGGTKRASIAVSERAVEEHA
jgi:branched-chain amino acid transport system permease protein